MGYNLGARNVSASIGEVGNVAGFLEITVVERHTGVTVELSKDRIAALFSEAFKGLCVACGSPNSSDGVLCCVCFPEESRCHADCCLAEEGENE